MNRWITMLIAVLIWVIFGLTVALTSQGADAQTTLTVPLTPPPPAAFTLTINQPVTLNGVTYQVTGTLTLTPTGAPPVVTPPPAGSSAISRVTDTAGATVTTGPAGGIVVVIGAGLGSFGVATVAGLNATVKTWTPTTVTLTLPATGSATGTAQGPLVLKPGDAPVATSSFDFTITGLSASLPPPSGPTWESPVISVSQTLDDPQPLPEEEHLPQPEPPLLLAPPGPLLLAVTGGDGSPLTLAGQWFGDPPGMVSINEQLALVVSWSDSTVEVSSAGLDAGASVLIRTAAGQYCYGGLGER